MTDQRLDTEQTIRDWLSDSVPDRAPASLRETLEDVTSGPAGHASPWPRRGYGLRFAGRVAAALAILAIAGSGLYLYGNLRTAEPAASAAKTAGATATGTAGATGAPGITPPHPNVMHIWGSNWNLVDGALPQMVASSWGSFRSPIFSLPGGGFLAFVPSTAGPTAPTSWTTRVFQSTDGVNWTERSILPSDAARVTAVTEAGGQIVAVGWTTSGPDVLPMTWTSADLHAWRATALPATKDALGTTAYGVAPGPAGFLAWGLGGQPGTDFWISTDGATWRSLTTTGLPADAAPDALFDVPGGYAIRGTLLSSQAAVWQSSDGATWTQTWTGPGMSGMEGYALGPVVRAPGGGYISFGGTWMAPGGMTATPQDLLIWTSLDGATWTPSDRINRPGWTYEFAALPGGYVTAGTQPARADAGAAPFGSLGIWTSPNGRTWQPRAGLPSVGPIEVLGVVGDGTHAVVVCVDQAGDIQLMVGGGIVV